jgi:predicted nucleic acid-binding protein
MSSVLVDTSCWVGFLRGEAASVRYLDRLLADGQVSMAGPIYSEVLSGAKDRVSYERLARLVDALEWVQPPSNGWKRVAEARFTLARQGVQAHLVDLLIAVTASAAGQVLMSRDRNFDQIARVVPLDLELY